MGAVADAVGIGAEAFVLDQVRTLDGVAEPDILGLVPGGLYMVVDGVVVGAGTDGRAAVGLLSTDSFGASTTTGGVTSFAVGASSGRSGNN